MSQHANRHSESSRVAGQILKAAFAYFALVFATGFVLGTVRTLWLVPRVGVRTAELLELPVMLIAVVLAARWVNRRRANELRPRSRLLIGLLALAFLLLAEIALGMALRNVSLTEALLDRDPVSGTAYSVALCLFAAMPWLLSRREARAMAGSVSRDD